MPKQAAKGDAAIKKAQDKASRRQMELYIYYSNGRIRKIFRPVK